MLLHLRRRGRSRTSRSSSSTPARLFAETLDYRDAADRAPRPDRRADRRARSRARPRRKRSAPGAVDDQSRSLLPHPQDRAARSARSTGFDAWFTGRKRFQNAIRADAAGLRGGRRAHQGQPAGRLVGARSRRPTAERHDLPEHPLVAKGYPSIGCVPCTTRVLPGEDQRAGRWRGLDKTECGIHLPLETDGSGI